MFSLTNLTIFCKKLGQRQNKSNIVLEGSTISRASTKGLVFASKVVVHLVVVHHFVPNFVRELSVSSKTMFSCVLVKCVAWAREYFGKSLSLNTVRRCINKCNLKLQRGRRLLILHRNAAEFSGSEVI